MKIFLHVIFIFAIFLPLLGNEEDLFRDLIIVEEINCCINKRMPITYNNFLTGGIINMPSARMGHTGEIGVGYSWISPYRTINLRMQLLDRLELTGNYRIFKGIKDPVLSRFGFGDFSDKGANIKWAILLPEDSDYQLPGLAVGWDDFLGTRAFRSLYAVATQVLLPYRLEASIGYGSERIQGLFGGFNWMPFYEMPFIVSAEYDATNYKEDPHPKGRESKTHWNIGLKYRLFDFIDLSASYVRGNQLAYSFSAFYNFGNTKGLIPKIHNPLPYQSPVVIEPLGGLRSREDLARDLTFALSCRGFELLDVRLTNSPTCGRVLRIHIVNEWYRVENEVRTQVTAVLAALLPSNIDGVIAVIEDEGFPIQQYRFCGEFLRLFREKKLCAFELEVLSPLQDVTSFDFCEYQLLYKKARDWFRWETMPKTHTFFGSATGKFKYTLGLSLLLDGYLFDSIYWRVKTGWTFYTNVGNTMSIDRLNPSQLLNVRTDSLLYYKQKGISLDEAYLQKNWNLGRGFYTKLAGGYFEQMYGGLAAQALWYPVWSNVALGAQGGVFKKREIHGLGITENIRELNGFNPTYRHFTGSQYFLDFYYDLHFAHLDLKIKAGKFLANDWGARFEVARYFPSGMRILFWYTRTNGKDFVNGERYYDKGIEISLPLDMFYTCSSRGFWNYGMSAWLRDVAQSADNGFDLFDLIRRQRQCNR